MRCELWIIAHKTKPELVYALGHSAQNAWANAVAVMYGDFEGDVTFHENKGQLFAKGFRARRCTVEVHSA